MCMVDDVDTYRLSTHLAVILTPPEELSEELVNVAVVVGTFKVVLVEGFKAGEEVADSCACNQVVCLLHDCCDVCIVVVVWVL